jgi:hypothetical protein
MVGWRSASVSVGSALDASLLCVTICTPPAPRRVGQRECTSAGKQRKLIRPLRTTVEAKGQPRLPHTMLHHVAAGAAVGEAPLTAGISLHLGGRLELRRLRMHGSLNQA